MLEVKNLSYHIKGKYLLKNITLNFDPGCLYGILGPNGSGKSTLLKTMAGIWQPSYGEVLWQGQNLHDLSRKEISQIITLVSQNTQMYFNFPVSEMVGMGRYAYQTLLTKEKDLDDKVSIALAQMDVLHLKDRLILELSTGELQRVYLARALITESPVILLDEPTSSLDVRHQIQLWNIMQDLALKGKIIIVACHHLSAAMRYCGQLVVLNDGCCAGTGNSRDIVKGELLESIFGIYNLF